MHHIFLTFTCSIKKWYLGSANTSPREHPPDQDAPISEFNYFLHNFGKHALNFIQSNILLGIKTNQIKLILIVALFSAAQKKFFAKSSFTFSFFCLTRSLTAGERERNLSSYKRRDTVCRDTFMPNSSVTWRDMPAGTSKRPTIENLWIARLCWGVILRGHPDVLRDL